MANKKTGAGKAGPGKYSYKISGRNVKILARKTDTWPLC